MTTMPTPVMCAKWYCSPLSDIPIGSLKLNGTDQSQEKGKGSGGGAKGKGEVDP